MKPSISDIKALFDAEWPNNSFSIEDRQDKQIRLRQPVGKTDLRPGNTVSGPFMMSLVDTALYAAVLAQIGLVPMAVTTNININFLRRPTAEADVIAVCNLLKVGQKLIVGEVSLFSDGDPAPIAHAVGTYAVPPKSVK